MRFGYRAIVLFFTIHTKIVPSLSFGLCSSRQTSRPGIFTRKRLMLMRSGVSMGGVVLIDIVDSELWVEAIFVAVYIDKSY